MNSRLANIASSGSPTGAQTYAAYAYLGLGTIVKVAHPAVSGGLTLDYGADGSAGLDRFGRVIDQKWQTDGETPTVLDEYAYGYDRGGPSTLLGAMSTSNGNMTADANLLYKYDAWNRLAEVRRRADNSLIATYKHDGTNRRIRKFLPTEGGDANVTYDYYYDFQWRLVEVRKNGSVSTSGRDGGNSRIPRFHSPAA